MPVGVAFLFFHLPLSFLDHVSAIKSCSILRHREDALPKGGYVVLVVLE